MSGIILFKGDFQYSAVNIFIDQMAEAFSRSGYEPIVIDLVSSKKKESAKKLLEELDDCDFVFGPNGLGYHLTFKGYSLFDYFKVPFIAWLIDHPLHRTECFNNKNCLYTTVDRTHALLIQHHLAPGKVLGFLPHGGSVTESESCEKDIEILFSGTGLSFDVRQFEGNASALEIRFFHDLKDLTMKMDFYVLDEIAFGIIENYGMNVNDKNVLSLIFKIIPIVDSYIRAYRRNEILKRLDHAGLAVQLFGNNWDSFHFQNHVIHPPVSFYEILKLMNRSKIVLNINSGFPDGGHERVFSAMLNSALVISEMNQYYLREFNEDEDIVLYKWTELDSLPMKLNFLINNPLKLHDIAEAGFQHAKQKHTWLERVKTLIAFSKNIKRMNNS